MMFDAMAWRARQSSQQGTLKDPTSAPGYLSALADDCLATGEAPDKYRRLACGGGESGATGAVNLPPAELGLDCWLPRPLSPRWFSLCVGFELQSPWFAKDDRPSHPLDNPVRKDPVFGTPYLSASSWKGLLRWACRMEQLPGLLEHLHEHPGESLRESGWEDDATNRWLFGNQKGTGGHFQRGVLAFHPTWFDRIGYEIINPHSRTRRAGTHPIPYEVVPAGTTGHFSLLFAPPPGSHPREAVEPEAVVDRILTATCELLTCYGISAKRTAGWGLTKIKKWSLQGYCEEPISWPPEDSDDTNVIESAVPESIRDAAIQAVRGTEGAR